MLVKLIYLFNFIKREQKNNNQVNKEITILKLSIIDGLYLTIIELLFLVALNVINPLTAAEIFCFLPSIELLPLS